MAGTWDKPTRKSAASITEFLQLAADSADAALVETTEAHRSAGFPNGEPANGAEFSYIMQRMWQWFRRTGASLQFDHRAATVTIGGAVTIGDTRRIAWTFPAVFSVDYVTDAGDASNDDIADGLAAAINADPTAASYVVASASGAVVTLEMIEGGAPVTWAASQPVVVGAPTTVLADLNTDTTLCVRVADDDSFPSLNFLIGSSSMEDIGANGDFRMMFDIAKGAFRAGTVDAAQWDDANRGAASAAFGTGNTASGANSTAFGENNTASGTESLAGGTNTTASGDQSVALGQNVTATHAGAMALGLNAAATQILAFAVGSGQASGIGAIAMGQAATGPITCASSGTVSVAIGSGTKATADYAVGIGELANASALNATAIGRSSVCSSADGVAIGRDATCATAVDGLAIGTSTDCTANGATAVGFGAQASAVGAIALGASQNGVGTSANASQSQAIAIGAGGTQTSDAPAAAATRAIVVGTGSAAADTSAVAVGTYALAHQPGMFALSTAPILPGAPTTSDRGSAQVGIVTRTSQTTGATPEVLGGGTLTIEVRDGTAVHGTGNILEIKAGAATYWPVEFIAYNNAGVTVTFGTTGGSVGSATTATVGNPTAVGTTGVSVTITGIAATNINWIGRFDITEIVLP